MLPGVPILALAALFLSAPSASAHPFHYVTHQPGEVDYWPRWEPDGKTILFSRCDISTGCGGAVATESTIWALYTVPSRGGQATEFLDPAKIDGASATRSNWLWTSDPSITTPIAFTSVVSPNGGENAIYLVDANGETPIMLAKKDSIPDAYPSWFPDGSAVAVEGQPNGFSGPYIDLVEVPDESWTQPQTSTDQVWTGEPAISRHDGTLLAFAGQPPVSGSQYSDDQNQIWIQNLIPNGAPADFDTGLHQLDPLQGRTPDWSPNDRFLTFESKRGCLSGNYAIFIEAASTGKAVQVTDCRLNANHAVWSPDGRRFAFSAEFFSPPDPCAAGCRGIAIASVPRQILKLGTK